MKNDDSSARSPPSFEVETVLLMQRNASLCDIHCPSCLTLEILELPIDLYKRSRGFS